MTNSQAKIIDPANVPDQLDIMVDVACNAGCDFCVQEATFKPSAVDEPRFLNSLEDTFELFRKGGGRKVVITGGEPLLQPGKVMSILDLLSEYSFLTLKALYTNGSRLLDAFQNDKLVVEVLEEKELDCVNLSVHHVDNKINNEIFQLPEKPDTEKIVNGIRAAGLPFRFNLTLQKGGVESTRDVVHYIEWATDLGVKDIYIRELFQFDLDRPQSRTNRSPIQYSHDNYVDSDPIIEKLMDRDDFQYKKKHEEEYREKTEFKLVHKNTSTDVIFSSLEVGNEDPEGIPYLVFMPDGNLYKGWLGARDKIDAQSSIAPNTFV